MVETRLRTSFAKQGLMRLFGAEMTSIVPGQVEISLTPKPELSQQHGFVHGGVLKAGRTLSLVQTEIFAVNANQERLIAFLTATFMTIENRDGIED